MTYPLIELRPGAYYCLFGYSAIFTTIYVACDRLDEHTLPEVQPPPDVLAVPIATTTAAAFRMMHKDYRCMIPVIDKTIVFLSYRERERK
jgi:hypothetical protein